MKLLNEGQIWKHRKGGEYRIVGFCTIEATLKPAVLYKSTNRIAPTIWARPEDEFTDGRFEFVRDR